MVDVLVPEVGEGVTEGNIVEWLKKDGETVKEGEPLLTIETQKVTFEITSPASGVLRVLKPQGSTVKVSERIAMIEEVKEEVKEIETKKEEARQEVATKLEAEKPELERVRASPRARRLAREYQVDLTTVKGTGPNGLVTEEDVRAVIEAKAAPATEEPEEVIPLAGWRKTMAEKMAQSKRTAAHITTFAEVDMTELVSLREKLLPVVEEKAKLKLTYTPFIIKAVAQALLEYPIVNSSLVGDRIVVKKYCNIGIAMAREKGGLIVPVMHHVEKMNLIEIAQKLEELTEKARAEKLSIEDVRGGTFTITNVGMLGVIFNTPIINTPESAILGVGAVVKRPVVVDDQIVIRHRMYLSLSYDHRVIDGLPAIRFLQRVRQLLENPYALLPI